MVSTDFAEKCAEMERASLRNAYRWVPAEEVDRHVTVIRDPGFLDCNEEGFTVKLTDDVHRILSARNIEERNSTWIRRIGEKLGVPEPEPLRPKEEQS